MGLHALPKGNNSYLVALQAVFFGSVILYFGRTFFIPLSFAVLISFVLYPICVWLEGKSINRMASILFSMSVVILFGAAIILLLVYQFTTFISEWPVIKVKLLEVIEQFSGYIFTTFGVSRIRQNELLTQILNQSSGNLFTLIRHLISTYSLSAVLLILVPIYSTLILFYRKRLVKALYMIFPIESRVGIKAVLSQTITAYYNFIKGMGIVYLAVGTLNSVGLLVLGVPHAIFFGYTAAILTFIPYVGIMVGALLPMTMSWITYNSIWYPIGVVFLFSLVQYLEANLIFPLAVSNKLKINALATISAIVVGGIIWGVAGMILFVPFLAIAKLIVDNSPKLKTWSVLLGTSSIQN